MDATLPMHADSNNDSNELVASETNNKYDSHNDHNELMASDPNS